MLSIVQLLFRRFAGHYGKHWLSMWEGVPMESVMLEWQHGLSNVSDQQMRHALDSLLTSGKAFPPTLPEFVGLCRQFRSVDDHQRKLSDMRRDDPPGGFQAIKDVLKRAAE